MMMRIPDNHPRAAARDTSRYVECKAGGRMLVVEVADTITDAFSEAQRVFIERFALRPTSQRYI